MWWVGALLAGQVATSTPTALDRFEGSRVVLQASTTVATLAPDLQLTHNPYVDTSLLLLPRFAIGEHVSVWGQLGLAVEWTNSDSTDLRNEVELSDLTLGASWNGLPRPFAVVTTLRFDLTIPLSEVSRASTLIVAPALAASVARAFPVLDGELAVAASGLYRRPFYQYTTPGVDVPRSYAPQCFGGSVGCADQLSGVANARDVLSWSLELSGRWGDVSPGLAWRMTHVLPYDFADVAGVERLEDRASARVSTYAAAWVGYAVTAVIGVEVGYQIARNVLSEDGKLGNPLFDRYQDMRLYLSLSYAIGSWSLVE